MRVIHKIRSLMFVLVLLSISAASFAQIGISISIAPPELPVYDQPVCPGDGYIWTPGYWAYADDYYWVPGTWVLAPEIGFLWTPPYWGWEGGGFLFHEGYWGPHVGFYGGISYGFGYFGVGYEGGRWDGDHFFYNRSVNNVNVTYIHNVYNTTINHTTVNRVSFNGGNGGINARPTSEEEAASRDRHVPPVAAQAQHVEAARGNPQLRNATNHGRPPITATSRPGEFNDHAAPAKEGNKAGNPVHPNDIPRGERPTVTSTGNAKQDRKYQQQQDKLVAQQVKERAKLQQQQDKEHQQLTKQKADDSRTQQVEQKHQQQTQELVQRHTQQQQTLQSKQQPKAHR